MRLGFGFDEPDLNSIFESISKICFFNNLDKSTLRISANFNLLFRLQEPNKTIFCHFSLLDMLFSSQMLKFLERHLSNYRLLHERLKVLMSYCNSSFNFTIKLLCINGIPNKIIKRF